MLFTRLCHFSRLTIRVGIDGVAAAAAGVALASPVMRQAILFQLPLMLEMAAGKGRIVYARLGCGCRETVKHQP